MSTTGNKGGGTPAVAKVAGDRAKLTFARGCSTADSFVILRTWRVCARPAPDSDPVRRQGPERGSTGGGGRPRSFPSGPPLRGGPEGGTAGRQSRPASYGRHRKRCLSGPPLRGGPEGVAAGRQSRPASYGRHRKRCLSGPPLRGGPEGVTAGR